MKNGRDVSLTNVARARHPGAPCLPATSSMWAKRNSTHSGSRFEQRSIPIVRSPKSSRARGCNNGKASPNRNRLPRRIGRRGARQLGGAPDGPRSGRAARVRVDADAGRSHERRTIRGSVGSSSTCSAASSSRTLSSKPSCGNSEIRSTVERWHLFTLRLPSSLKAAPSARRRRTHALSLLDGHRSS